jgi:hypothetical protein
MIGHELGKRGHEPSPDLPDGFQMTELGALPHKEAVMRLLEAEEERAEADRALNEAPRNLGVLFFTTEHTER